MSLRLSGVFQFTLDSPPLSELPPFKRFWLSAFEAIRGNSDSFRYFIANSLACINTPRHSAKDGNPRQLQTRRFSFSGEPTILKDPASLAQRSCGDFPKDPKSKFQSSYFVEEKTTRGRKPRWSRRESGAYQRTSDSPPWSEKPPFKRRWPLSYSSSNHSQVFVSPQCS